MRRALILCVGLSVASLLLPAAAVAQSDARAGIEAVNKQFGAAVARGDAAALAGFYTAGAQLMPPNAAMVTGRANIEKLWKDFLGMGITSLTLTASEVEAHGDTAIEVGSYELAMKDGKTADRGKYIVVWKREKGQWRLHRDIWNSNMPAAGQ